MKYMLLLILSVIVLSCGSEDESSRTSNTLANKKEKSTEPCTLDTSIVKTKIKTSIRFQKKNCDCNELYVMDINHNFIKKIPFRNNLAIFDNYFPNKEQFRFGLCSTEGILYDHVFHAADSTVERIVLLDMNKKNRTAKVVVNPYGYDNNDINLSCSGCKLVNKEDYFLLKAQQNKDEMSIAVSGRTDNGVIQLEKKQIKF